MPKVRLLFLSAAVGLALSACGGSDGPTEPGGNNNNGGNSGTGGETRTVKSDPSFSSDIWEIFTRRGCTAAGCHGGGQGGLTMTSASGAFAALVGVASTGTGEVLVSPSNVAGSYLVKKLEGTATVGARMPLGGSALDNTDLQNIKNWISQGAKNN